MYLEPSGALAAVNRFTWPNLVAVWATMDARFIGGELDPLELDCSEAFDPLASLETLPLTGPE